jgi:pyruvyltransferase
MLQCNTGLLLSRATVAEGRARRNVGLAPDGISEDGAEHCDSSDDMRAVAPERRDRRFVSGWRTLLPKLKSKLRALLCPGQSRPQPGATWNELPYPTARLFVWRPSNGRVNFGDFLSRVIVDLVLASRGLTLGDETRESFQLIAIGSVLHFASDGAVVWGSGVNGKMPVEQHTFRKLDVRAVRGPLTRAFLTSRGIPVPEVYGDPGLLLPVLAPQRFKRSAGIGPGFVPNLNDLAELDTTDMRGVPVISPLHGWNRCVEAILRHDLILASSLHGLIIAEAYGIPARYVRLSETENLFKYRDYYAGTGRPDFSYASSVAEGLEMGGELPPVFDAARLMQAFPFELWT